MSISIILPIRNSEITLKRSIESVLDQTYQDFEILCVINDSIDKSEEIVSNYAKNDNRVKILTSSPGIVPALNAGLRSSSFDLIARQDADDFWYPEKLQMQVDFLEKNPEIDILGVQIRAVNTDFNPIGQEPMRPTRDEDIKRSLLSGWNVIAHPGVLFHRRIMEKLGGYDDTFPFAEDYSLWLRAVQWYKFANLEKILVDYTAKHNEKYNHAVPRFLCSIYRSLYGVQ